MNPRYKGKVPDVFTFNGLLDILSICNLMELGNVIHYKSYTQDGLSSTERANVVQGRVFARQVRCWLRNSVEVHHPSETPSLRSFDDDVFYPYLASQAAALRNYKKRAPASGAQGHVDFKLKDLDAQIKGAFLQDSRLMAQYNPSIDPKTFDWTGITFQVKSIAGGSSGTVNINESGETHDDLEWKKINRPTQVADVLEDADEGSEDTDQDSEDSEEEAPPKKRPRV